MAQPDDAEDAQLMADLAAGDDSALNALIARWQRPLRSFVFRSVSNEADTEDILQETFVRVFRHCTRFRPGSRFSTWLFTIAVNLCRNHVEKARRRKNVSLETLPGGERGAARSADTTATNEPIPSDTLLAEERAVAVRDAIHALPDDLRSAVLLFEYEHLSHAEIAEIENTTPKAIETRLYRARKKLRESLARWLAE